MIDVVFLKTPVTAHIVLILATTEDGSIRKVVYTKTRDRQFDAREVLESLLVVRDELRGMGIEDHLLAIVADEDPNNALLVEAGYPVLVDLHHLIKRMDTGMGHADVLLQAVHKHVVFRQHSEAEKFAVIRAMADSIPASARRKTLSEINAVERVVARRFAVLGSPFHLRECNNDVLESLGRKLATEASLVMAEALTAEPRMKARLLEVHELLRRVVCLLSMLEKLDVDLSGLAD
ncbi:uncharacterized protein [Drosophila kikkawai]|nr:uncharacterized protein LOC108078154 isoform X2 [Drosophila kikkawai]